jgi:hypothetical protein
MDSRPKIRPIDIEYSVAEKIGREAIEKLGYDEIITLAERAKFVKYQIELNTQLILYDAATTTGFARVFSQYAVTAAVTSQVDSPLPGPADLVGLGIMVGGIVDAGLLGGLLLATIQELLTTRAAVSSTTIPCPPCRDPPAPDSRRDIVPPAAPHWPCPGTHTHYYT